jgi:hypothetical protein
MLCWEITAVYDMKSINTLPWQHAELFDAKAGGMCNNHAFKG